MKENFDINPDKLYNTYIAAKKLDIVPKTLRYKIRMGQIKAYNLNKAGERPDYSIKGADLINFIIGAETE